MIAVAVPGAGEFRLLHLVCDYNGTLAVDGTLLPGAGRALSELARDLQVHVVTADTFGEAAAQLDGLPVGLTVLAGTGLAEAKLEYVSHLGAAGVVAIGNGRNDAMMLRAARLGIAVVQKEGVAGVTLAAADIVAVSVTDALDLLRLPQRLVATLRT